MSLVATHIALADLQSTSCRCGTAKGIRKAHCRACYLRLPEPMRQALYRRVGNGYEEAYTDSLTYLRLPIPTEPMPERRGFTFKPDAPHA